MEYQKKKTYTSYNKYYGKCYKEKKWNWNNGKQVLEYIKETYHETLKNINEFIADIDFISCGAFLAVTNNYHKPTIEESADKAFILAKDIRHPIVENISDKEYIRNDVCLGKGGIDGILLYVA